MTASPVIVMRAAAVEYFHRFPFFFVCSDDNFDFDSDGKITGINREISLVKVGCISLFDFFD